MILFLRRFLLIAFLVGLALPVSARWVQALRDADPCGMVLCCCPEMCRTMKTRRPVCIREDAVQCGLSVPAAATQWRSAPEELARWGLPAAATVHMPLVAEVSRRFIVLDLPKGWRPSIKHPPPVCPI